MLKVKNLIKTYGAITAVDGVSLQVQRGEIFGLLGPNGAGKTTTIRTILNIIEPDSGEILINDKPFCNNDWDVIGYLPEERGLYKKSKIINTILYFASLKGLDSKDAKIKAEYWLNRFGLQNFSNRKIEELSKGNQQKIQLIISILHNPQLLILDEPFSGLDPVNQILLKDVLMELKENNVAIIFSTHQLEQVEKLCDNICLINKGKTVLHGEIFQLKKLYGTNSVHLEFEGDAEFLHSCDMIKHAYIYYNCAELELHNIADSKKLLCLINEKLNIKKFEIVEPSLQSMFLKVVGVEFNKAGIESIVNSNHIFKNIKQVTKKIAAKKELLNLILSIVLTLGFVVYTLYHNKNQIWIAVGFAFIIIVNAMRYIKAVQKEREEIK